MQRLRQKGKIEIGDYLPFVKLTELFPFVSLHSVISFNYCGHKHVMSFDIIRLHVLEFFNNIVVVFFNFKYIFRNKAQQKTNKCYFSKTIIQEINKPTVTNLKKICGCSQT